MGIIKPTSAQHISPTPQAAASAPSDSPAVHSVKEVEQNLPTVKVKASGAENKQAGKSQVSAQELLQVPGAQGDVMRALQSLPGVVSADGESSEPAIKGARPEDNVYTLNGLPVGNLFQGGGMSSAVPSSLVRRVDMHGAAFGPEWADVMGGAIAVVLRPARTDRLGGSLNVNLLGMDAVIEGPVTPAQSFYWAGQRSYLDVLAGRNTQAEEGVVDQVPVYSSYVGHYRWQLSEVHAVSWYVMGANDRSHAELRPDAEEAQQEPLLLGTVRDRQRYQTTAGVWDADWDAHTRTRLSVGQKTDHFDGQLAQAARGEKRNKDRFVMGHVEWPLTPDHQVLTGVEIHRESERYALSIREGLLCTEFTTACDISSSGLREGKGDVNLAKDAVYVKDRWQLQPNWSASLGLRHSRDIYLQRSSTEPRIGLAWQQTDQTQWSAGWGRHHQRPETVYITPELGNPQLDQQRSTHQVMGVWHRINPAWSWQTEVYRKTFDGLVQEGGKAAEKYINAGRGRAHGIEMMLKKNEAVSSAWSGWLAMTWGKSRRYDEVNHTAFDMQRDTPLTLDVVLGRKLSNGWWCGSTWTYSKGTPYTPIVGTGRYQDGRVKPQFAAINSDRMPSQHQWDVRIQRHVSSRFNFYIDLINVYAHRNVIAYAYSGDYGTRKEVVAGMPMFSFGVKTEF